MTKKLEEKNADSDSPLDRLVMPVVGYVIYDVRVSCPHCNKTLCLNQYPYDDQLTEYSLAEDELGLALFGKTNDPAKWSGLEIEYQCNGCDEIFYLGSLEP